MKAHSLRAAMIPLTPDFFAVPAEALARRLIGCAIVSHAAPGRVAGLIVETEAYLGEADGASHAVRGMTAAQAALADGPGALYVHPMRGRWAVDIVASGGSVLLRAAEPLEGLDIAGARRGTTDPVRLMRGPACLGQALAVTRTTGGARLTDDDGPLALAIGESPDETEIAQTPRIGISRATHLPLRFYRRGSPFVSAGRIRRTPEAR